VNWSFKATLAVSRTITFITTRRAETNDRSILRMSTGRALSRLRLK
jgi:hypothetical protein